MLGTVARKVTLWVIVGLIALAMVIFFGIGGMGPGGSVPDAVASVGGERISLELFGVYRRAREEQERSLREMGIPARDVTRALDQQVVNQLIQQQLLFQHARDMGLRVGDDELRADICADPNVQRGGRCDPQAVDQLRQYLGFATQGAYFEARRRELLVQKLVSLVEDPIRVSDEAARAQLRRERTTVQLEYVALRARDFADEVELDDDAIAAFASEQPDAVRDAYELRQSEFRRPEQLRVRHVLFTGDEAEAQAQAALERLASEDDEAPTFEELAQELSQDAATAELGGDLGFLDRAAMLPAFAETAFAAEVGTPVGPVETERGFHLLRVEERRAALETTLEEATPQLARELLLEERSSERARERAEELSTRVAAGVPLADAARDLDLELRRTTPFGAQMRVIPGLDPIPGLREAALSLRPDRPASSQIFGERDVFYLISLVARNEPSAEELDAQLESARVDLENRLRQQATAELTGGLLEAASEAGEVVTYDDALGS